jgi:hypothetical protein
MRLRKRRQLVIFSLRRSILARLMSYLVRAELTIELNFMDLAGIVSNFWIDAPNLSIVFPGLLPKPIAALVPFINRSF